MKKSNLCLLVMIGLMSLSLLSADENVNFSNFSLQNLFSSRFFSQNSTKRVVRNEKNERGNITEVISQYCNSPDVWTSDVKLSYTYDEMNRVIQSYDSYWNDEMENWERSARYSYYWNEMNLVDNIVIEQFDEEWIPIISIMQNYNAQNHIENIGFWLIWGTELFLIQDMAFFYDANGMVESFIQTEYWEDFFTNFSFLSERPSRQNYTKVSFLYDTNGRISESVQQYSYDEENWYNSYRSTTEYHINDTSEYSNYQDYFNNLIFHMATGMLFWEMPMFSEETHYSWYDWGVRLWELMDRYEYVYYPNDKLDSVLNLTYIEQNWEVAGRNLLVYDTDWLLTENLEQYYDGFEWYDSYRTLIFRETSEVNDLTIAKFSIILTNYPNPFNPQTTIAFDLPVSAYVTLNIYNLKGQKVKSLVNHDLAVGFYQFVWDGTDEKSRSVSGGVYLCRIQSNDFHTVKKLLLLK
jgi:hypothetical protein